MSLEVTLRRSGSKFLFVPENLYHGQWLGRGAEYKIEGRSYFVITLTKGDLTNLSDVVCNELSDSKIAVFNELNALEVIQ